MFRVALYQFRQEAKSGSIHDESIQFHCRVQNIVLLIYFASNRSNAISKFTIFLYLHKKLIRFDK